MKINAFCRLMLAVLLVVQIACFARAEITFMKVADMNTIMPGSGSTASEFWVPSISAGKVAFNITDSDPLYRGTYTFDTHDSSMEIVADTANTLWPGTSYTVFPHMSASISNGRVGFTGTSWLIGDKQGSLAKIDDALVVLAGKNMSLPGGGQLNSGSMPYINDDSATNLGWSAVFGARDNNEKPGLYKYADGNISLVANRNTPVPGGTENFVFFRETFISDGKVVFVGDEAVTRQLGIYSYENGTIDELVAPDELLPNPYQEFGAMKHIYRMSSVNDRVLFSAYGESSANGVFKVEGGVISVVADWRTKVLQNDGLILLGGYPGAGGVALGENGACAFIAARTGLGTRLYSDIGGTLRRIIGEGDTLLGSTPIKYIYMTSQALSESQIAFHVTFNDNTQGIYVATVTEFDPDLDGDHDIDARDLNLFLSNYESEYHFGASPFYDAIDLEELLSRYGETGISPAPVIEAGALPEPASSTLLCLGAFALLAIVRRKGRCTDVKA